MPRVRFVRPALIAAAVLTTAAFVALLLAQRQQLRLDLAQARTESSQRRAELAATSAHAAALDRQVLALDSALGDTKTRLTQADTRAATLGRDLHETRALLAARDARVARLEQDFASLERELAAERASAATLPGIVAGLERTIAGLEAQVAGLHRQLDAARSSHAPAVPAAAAPRRDPPRVLAIGPRNAFVVLDFGANHGASARQQLQILRGSVSVALLELSDVRENLSIAQVRPDSLQGSLRKGDVATFLP